MQVNFKITKSPIDIDTGGDTVMEEAIARCELHNAWQRWRIIQNQIISHPSYRYGARYSILAGRLARFCSEMMGHYNTAYWLRVRPETKAFYLRRRGAHERRKEDRRGTAFDRRFPTPRRRCDVRGGRL